MKLVTATGREIDPADPCLADICIEDIAYGLAKEERFDGNTIVPYSVAQHSVHVANLIAAGWKNCEPSRGLVAAGLLHDAAEAYLGDVVTPLKQVLPDYRALEARWEQVIFDRFGLDPRLGSGPAVKEADTAMLYCEAFALTTRAEVYGVDRILAGHVLNAVHKQYKDVGSVMPPFVWDRHRAAKEFLALATLLKIE